MTTARDSATLPVRAVRYGAWWLGQQARSAFWARRDARELTVGSASAVVPTPTGAAARRTIALDREERPYAERMLTTVEPTDVVWDVGACIGTYAALFADRVDRGHVVAVEPAPANAQLLSQQFDACDGVTVAEVALGDRSGTAPLRVDGDEPGAQQHRLAEPRAVADTIEVPVRRADDLVAHVPAPDVLKVDVEGAGLAALRGFGDLLDGVRVVAIEPHGNAAELADWLSLSGFDVERVPLAGIRDGEHSLLATRDGGESA